MSGSSNTPDIETLAEAGREFAQGNISQSQLEQVQSGQASLDEVRSSDGGSEQSDESESESDTEQSDSSGSSAGSSSSRSDSDSSSPQATTNPGGAVGNNPQQEQSQQQQDGIDAPTIQELGEAGQEFASGGDVSQEDLENADARFNADVDNDGTIDDTDAEQLADAGQFEAAQALEEEIDTATGTEGDGTPDDLTAPTVEDVLGGDRQVDSAQEADALAEAARQSPEISQDQADRLLDQAVDDEQGTVTSRDTGVLENQDFADQPGSAAFSRFDIAPPGGSTNPALGERTSVEDELILDRRGSAGEIESITINGEEVDVSGRSVGPETESGGDASTDRLAIDLGQLGVDPGTAEIEVEERFGPQGQLGTETTQIEALVTEDAPEVDNEAFEEQFQGTQTQDEVQNAISGSEAEAILGEETVDELGGQQEAAAAVSRELQGQADPDPDPQPSSSPAPSQQEQQPAPEGETVIASDGSLVDTINEVVQVGDSAQQQGDTNVVGLAGNVGSVTDPNATQPQPQTDAGVQAGREIDQAVADANRRLSGRRGTAVENAQQEAAQRRTDAQGETAAAVNRFGQQQLDAQQEIFGDVPVENPVTGNRVEEDLAGVADEFQDSAETVFANLGRVQPTPVTVGTGGTRTADETTSGIRGAGAEGFIGSINPAEILGDAKEAGEFAVERGDEVGAEIFEPTADLLAGNEVETNTELQQDLTQRGSLIADEAQENPGETAASVIGGAVGGVGAGVGAARAGRGAVRGARSADIDVDLDDVADAAVSGRRSGGSSSSITGRDAGDIVDEIFGPRSRFRQRREPGRDIPDEQEQIEKTEQIERDAEQTEIGQDTLDELARRQNVADDVADVEAAARRRLPPKREFETDAEFRRELERAIRQEEQKRRQAQREAESRADTETDTDTDAQTQAGIPALSVGAVDGVGAGGISRELEPEIPNPDISQPQQEQERVTEEEAMAGVAGQPSAGQAEAILDPDTGQDSTQEGTTVGGTIGGGQQMGSLEEELNQGVGEQEAVGIAEEIGIGEEIGFQDEQGTQEELGIGEEIGIGGQVGIQIGEEIGTQIGEEVQIGEQIGEQITDTPGQPQITDTPPRDPPTDTPPRTPPGFGDDGDDDEFIIDENSEDELFSSGIQAADQVLGGSQQTSDTTSTLEDQLGL